jgi:serine/threonine protein kinase
MGRRGAKHRSLVGLAVCTLLAVLAIVRESLDTRAVLESILVSYSSQTVPPSLVSLQDRGISKSIDFYGLGSKNKNGTAGIAPRVVILLPSFLISPLPQLDEPQSTTILRTMSYPMEHINPLYSDQDSSAGEMLRNQQQLSSQSIEFLGLRKYDVSSEAAAATTPTSSVGKSNSKSKLNHPRMMEMPEAGSMDWEDKVYRRFEREWYEDCVPVTIEPTSRNNHNHKQKYQRKSATMTAQSTCNMFHELDVAEAYGSIPSESNGDENNPAKTAGQRENHIELLGQGSWRSVWKLTTTGSMDRRISSNISEHALDDYGEKPGLVLKLLHTHHNYDEYSFSIHQTDAIVMEALAESNYVVDSFGFCGQSVITEASVTSGRSLIKTKSLKSIDRLCIARDLARGLADLHALVPHLWEEQSSSSSSNNSRALHTRGEEDDQDGHFSRTLHPLVFAHHDVNPANLISAGDGRIKWNDFNLGLFNRYKHEEETISNATECPVPVRYEQLLWRSPEECDNRTGTLFLDTERTGKNTAAQAADVYSLGNILFYVLARHQPWSHLEEGENESQQQQYRGDEPLIHNNHPNATATTVTAAKLDTGSSPEHKQASLIAISKAKVEGRLPNLPERYLDQPGARILWEAVKMCYTHDPRLRPRAREIAEFLGTAHSKLFRREGKENHNTTTTTKIETSSKRKSKHVTASSERKEKEMS